MKENSELGVSDDKESIFSTLKSRNSCLNPMGTWKKKKVLKNKDNLHFWGHNLFSFKDILVNEDNLKLQTSALYW